MTWCVESKVASARGVEARLAGLGTCGITHGLFHASACRVVDDAERVLGSSSLGCAVWACSGLAATAF